MTKILLLSVSVIALFALTVVSPGNAGAQEDRISARGNSFEKDGGSLDKIEDKLERDLKKAQQLDKKLDKFAEGTPEEEALDQEITALEKQILNFCIFAPGDDVGAGDGA
jgi:hypothetical protein